jgi:hypothetical protein
MHKDIGDTTVISHHNSAPPVMKKYYQLALVIISLVSVVTLLFYRHEYNRLRYVLEVLNFFGKPGGQQSSLTSDNCIIGNSSQAKEFLNFAEPEPAWQRLSNTHFLYSAYWEISGKERRVRALSIEFGDGIPDFACSFWFEDRDAAVLGTFSFSKIEMKETVKEALKDKNRPKITGYYLFCKAKDISSVPYGVSFYNTDDIVLSRVFIPVYYTSEKLLSNGTAVCIVTPPTPGLLKSAVAEFLSYHQFVGVTNYIIYNGGLPNKVLSSLRGAAVRERLGLSISVLLWNFPVQSREAEGVARLVMEKDCLFRTMGRVNNVAALTWEEYIVPRYHRLLPSMLDDFDSGRKTTSRFEIQSITFCIEFPDDEQAEPGSPLIFRKTRYSKIGNRERPFYVYRPHLISASNGDLAVTTQRVPQGIVAVHRYAPCSLTGKPVAEQAYLNEPAMLRFSGDLKKSNLLKAWSLSRLFT